MSLTLFAHPFSSYRQKVLIALYENDTLFTMRLLDHRDAGALAELKALWPLGRFPVLVDDGRVVVESSIIIEHLQLHHPCPVRLIPGDPRVALETRCLDRFFDNYVQTPLQKIVLDAIREPGQRDAPGVADARGVLETAYAWLDRHMDRREWAAGERFGLADCAAAPALFYADWTHPIGAAFANVRAYRSRLNSRPSFARAIDGGRPYRALFPLGAPDRD
jgi:glutathione S-transferase